ncbi:heme d1 biosynthesis radical SAM protein NirJ [Crenobacter caeni]|uniref:Pre-heme d1 synthase n=1 Tax=Crenobacter caeni TaxID=2705474 RepID=A0A6B2KVL3_9NEIS|nr:heme d1 biosynthesis radical SAM protein NirJ [Crenobacter caeni]NDV14043.1 heme d1 biosynthesis radical SAM protein NirJ [Crenobacter caeni]
MLRLTPYLAMLEHGTPAPRVRAPAAPVVIWNLIRRCNLTCAHCYTTSADKDFSGELSTDEVMRVMDSLRTAGVPALILSGGEPLMRADIFEIGARAKTLGFYLGLSSNGTLIDPASVASMQASGFDYVGVSLDGIGATHDRFRRQEGSYARALNGIRLARDAGLKVGVRFTLTEDNAADLPALLDLIDTECIDKFYFSHLNFAGRGNKHKDHAARHAQARHAMLLLFERARIDVRAGRERDWVTGNNDADAVFLLAWARQHYPRRADALQAALQAWGGNASGVNIANIDNLGNVHPDTMWWKITLGNVREREFIDIWRDTSHPLMAGLKARPRPVHGRCGACAYLALCNGNTRVRAWETTGDWWASDPACYLSDEEIGVSGAAQPAARHPHFPIYAAEASCGAS